MKGDGIDRRTFLARGMRAGAATAFLPVVLGESGPAKAGGREMQPNILFILTDQQRWDSLGAYGNSWVSTPNLDRLAREGTTFDRAYGTQPVCSPCRSSILTGRWPHSTGVTENCDPSGPAPPLGLDEPIFPVLLRRAGYRTGYIGKWHLSLVDEWAKKFDFWDGFQTGGGHWVGDRYKTDIQTEEGADFIRENLDRPFCLFMSYYPPHTPRTAPESFVRIYREKGVEEPEYYGMVSKLDENVGTLVRTLEELDLRRRTIVIFTSDHGDVFDRYWNRHAKRVCYDAGAKVPLIFSCPGRLPSGARRTGLVSSAALAPTILDLCGLPPAPRTQALSIVPLLRKEPRTVRRDLVIENYPVKPDHSYVERCVLNERWKLILDSRRPPELYDMIADPEEERNRFGEEGTGGVVSELLASMERWARETDDPIAPDLVAMTRGKGESPRRAEEKAVSGG